MLISCSVEELEPGMILGHNIYNKNNALLIVKGTVLTENAIRIIRKAGYKRIIFRQPGGNTLKISRGRNNKRRFVKFQNIYNKSTDELRNFIQHISDGHQVDVDYAYNITRNILDEFNVYELFSYINLINKLDDYTYGHCINVSMLCGILCNWAKCEPDILKETVIAGLLHDVGKVKISRDILQKPGKLDTKEWEEMKKHTIYGCRILEKAKAPESIILGSLYHHEREDGSGYPSGIAGGQIPFSAKVVAIADIYDAMTSSRPYRKRICPFEVINQFNEFYGTLDARILTVFLARIAECYVGEEVRLNDGRSGRILTINPVQPSRPLIQVSDHVIDLYNEPGLKIDSVRRGAGATD